MGLTSRERVLCALNHEEPDRVPLFLGTSGVTSVLGPAYPKLRAHLGLPATETRYLSKPFQYTLLDEDLMARLGSDGRPVLLGPAPSTVAKEVSPDCLIDEWGLKWVRKPGSLYFEVLEAPLANATIDDLDLYPWPDLCASSRFAGVAEKAKAVQQAGYATVISPSLSVFERAYMLVGIQRFLIDLIADPEFCTAVMQKIKSIVIPGVKAALQRFGQYADVICGGDDLGMQDRPMMSPAVYRKLVKPQQAEVLAAVKQHSRAKIFFHTCGNVYPLIGDLIDIGVDLLNPVQVSAGELGDTARLKREFGKRLSFNGAIDTGEVLPRGKPSDVRAEVRRRIKDLAPGGGYICSAVHCIQSDVPPENVVAMCEEIKTAGRYPLPT